MYSTPPPPGNAAPVLAEGGGKDPPAAEAAAAGEAVAAAEVAEAEEKVDEAVEATAGQTFDDQSEEPFPYISGDEVYALWGDDGLFYPCTIEEVRADAGECVVVFDAIPEGDQLQKTIKFSAISTTDGDSFTSFVVSNFIISEAESRKIPEGNWAHAGEQAWKALFIASVATLVGFVTIVAVVYNVYMKDDPEWHLKLSKWLRAKMGVPEKDPSKAIPISWTELLMILKDGEPPERIKAELDAKAREQGLLDSAAAESG